MQTCSWRKKKKSHDDRAVNHDLYVEHWEISCAHDPFLLTANRKLRKRKMHCIDVLSVSVLWKRFYK